MEIQGKVCVITGGTGGIGSSIVRKLLARGIKFIAIFDLDNQTTRDVFQKLKKEFKERVEFFPCDVTVQTQFKGNFEKVIESHKAIDILINNAGVGRERDVELMIDLNYKAVVMGTLAMIDHMGKHKGGKGGVVVNTGSVAGLSNFGMPIYCSTKHAVVSFTRNMNKQVDVTGVRVISICPALTDTPLATESLRKEFGLEFIDMYELIGKHGTAQKPDSVGDAVVYMIENANSGEVWVAERNLPPYLTKVGVENYRDLKVESTSA